MDEGLGGCDAMVTTFYCMLQHVTTIYNHRLVSRAYFQETGRNFGKGPKPQIRDIKLTSHKKHHFGGHWHEGFGPLFNVQMSKQ